LGVYLDTKGEGIRHRTYNILSRWKRSKRVSGWERSSDIFEWELNRRHCELLMGWQGQRIAKALVKKRRGERSKGKSGTKRGNGLSHLSSGRRSHTPNRRRKRVQTGKGKYFMHCVRSGQKKIFL